jgi:threonine dehydratase
LVDEVITVTEEEIVSAVQWLFDNANVVAEPSGAASAAAVLRDPGASSRRVAIISGGNVAAGDYARYITAAR